MRTPTAALLLAGLAAAGEPKTYELPPDPRAVVITLDFRGGYTPPRKNKAPYLTLRADGTLIVRNPFGNEKDLRAKLPPEEIQALLRFAIKKHRFFEFDRAKVQARIKATGKLTPMIADASSTAVSVAIKGKRKEVEYYALQFAAGRFPEIGALQDLQAIARRLNSLMAVTRAGGKQKATALLALANAELKKKHPNAKPFQLGDLVQAGWRQDGSWDYLFHRFVEGDTTSARIQAPAKGAPSVSVHHQPKE